jgi:hypothetical protein
VAGWSQPHATEVLRSGRAGIRHTSLDTIAWEGTGVEPDVKVKAADALETAVKLTESSLQKK